MSASHPSATPDSPTAADSALKSAHDLPEPPPEEFPRRFGAYTLVAALARGGMGEVFLGKTGGVAGIEKRCVVKTLRPHLTDDREYVARFVDEARIVVQLGHRNICQVFDVGVVGERYYLAMEYIAGRDLRTLATRAHAEQKLDAGLAIYLVNEVLDALDYAHRHVDAATGNPLLLVHRDISPQNVMVSFDGEVKLIDFGLAASALKLEQTQPNVVMGKLAYMAPEQVRGEKVDGRADLFAAAICLYEMLTGERFYDGRSPYEIWGLAAQGGFRPRLWEQIEPELRTILDEALAGRVDARFATCGALRDALQAHRYAHDLRGDAPQLRALAQRVFVAEIEENRQLLALLASSHSPGDSGKTPVMQFAEPTMSIARATVEAPTGSVTVAARARALTEVKDPPTEPTHPNPRGPLTRAPPPVVRRVALGAAITAAVALAAVLWVRSPSMRASIAPLASTVVAIAPAVVTPEPVPSALVPVVVPPTVLDAAPPLALPSALDAGLAPALVKRPKTPKPVVVVAAPVVEDAPRPVVASVRSYDTIDTKAERVTLLKQHCQAPCVSQVAAQFAGDWLKDPKGFADALRTCWVTSCHLP